MEFYKQYDASILCLVQHVFNCLTWSGLISGNVSQTLANVEVDLLLSQFSQFIVVLLLLYILVCYT